MSQLQDQLNKTIEALVAEGGVTALWAVFDPFLAEHRVPVAAHLSRNFQHHKRVRAVYLAARSLRRAGGAPTGGRDAA